MIPASSNTATPTGTNHQLGTSNSRFDGIHSFYHTTGHAACSRCSHYHHNLPIKLSTDIMRHTRIMCEKCGNHMFGLGGVNTQMTLAPVNSFPLEEVLEVEEDGRDGEEQGSAAPNDSGAAPSLSGQTPSEAATVVHIAPETTHAEPEVAEDQASITNHDALILKVVLRARRVFEFVKHLLESVRRFKLDGYHKGSISLLGRRVSFHVHASGAQSLQPAQPQSPLLPTLNPSEIQPLLSGHTGQVPPALPSREPSARLVRSRNEKTIQEWSRRRTGCRCFSGCVCWYSQGGSRDQSSHGSMASSSGPPSRSLSAIIFGVGTHILNSSPWTPGFSRSSGSSSSSSPFSRTTNANANGDHNRNSLPAIIQPPPIVTLNPRAQSFPLDHPTTPTLVDLEHQVTFDPESTDDATTTLVNGSPSTPTNAHFQPNSHSNGFVNGHTHDHSDGTNTRQSSDPESLPALSNGPSESTTRTSSEDDGVSLPGMTAYAIQPHPML